MPSSYFILAHYLSTVSLCKLLHNFLPQFWDSFGAWSRSSHTLAVHCCIIQQVLPKSFFRNYMKWYTFSKCFLFNIIKYFFSVKLTLNCFRNNILYDGISESLPCLPSHQTFLIPIWWMSVFQVHLGQNIRSFVLLEHYFSSALRVSLTSEKSLVRTICSVWCPFN